MNDESAGPLLYRCWTKATNREAGSPRRSASWVRARRGWLRVYADRLECGGWVLLVDAIRDAVLYRLKGGFGGFVLEVRVDEGVYQFGLNPWVRIDRHLPFAVRQESVALRSSPLSIALRVGLIGWLAYLAWSFWLAG